MSKKDEKEKTLLMIIDSLMSAYEKKTGIFVTQLRPFGSYMDAKTCAIRESPEWKYLSGNLSNVSQSLRRNERIIKIALMLADRIHESAEWSHVAKTDWSDEFFSRYEEKIAEGVGKDSGFLDPGTELCCYSGLRWEDNERYNRLAKTFAEAIVKKPVWAYVASLIWSDERFWPFAEMFAQAVNQDPELRYYARNGIRTPSQCCVRDHLRVKEGNWDNVYHWDDDPSHRKVQKTDNYITLEKTGLFVENRELQASGIKYYILPWYGRRRNLLTPNP